MKFQRGISPRKALNIGPAETIKKVVRSLRYQAPIISIYKDGNDILVITSYSIPSIPSSSSHYYPKRRNVSQKNPSDKSGNNLNKIIKNHKISEYIHKNYFRKNTMASLYKYYFKIREEYHDIFPDLNQENDGDDASR